MVSSAVPVALWIALAAPALPEHPDMRTLPQCKYGTCQLDMGRDLTWGGAGVTGLGIMSAGMATWGVVTAKRYGELAEDVCPSSSGSYDSCSLFRGQQGRGQTAMVAFGIGAVVLVSGGIAMLSAGASYRRWGLELRRRTTLTSGGLRLRF